MTRIYTPTQLSLFSISRLGAWWEEYDKANRVLSFPEPTELEKRLMLEGDDHEKMLMEKFRKEGKSIVDIGNLNLSKEDKFIKTIEFMKEGIDIISQGALKNKTIRGNADFLYRVEQPSNLGDWSYEPIECKLSSKSKTTFLIQACCYCDLLENILGRKPKLFHLYLGGGSKLSDNIFKFSDFEDWYNQLKSQYKQFIDNFDPNKEPDIFPGNHGKWTTFIEKELSRRKDLSLVAGMNKYQRHRLIEQSINTIDEFARYDLEKILVSKEDPLINLQKQAKAQVHPKNKDGTSYYEWIEIKEDEQIKSLPPPNKGDVWFDMESCNNAITGDKLEYLFGASYKDTKDNLSFKAWWAHDPFQEEKSFKDWVKWIEDRRSIEEYKDLHIYHYGHYEKAAMRQLQEKYTGCSDQIDEWLRSGLLVDLLPIVKASMYLGEEGYSIKNVEKIYPSKYTKKFKFKRSADVSNAVESIIEYELWKESGEKIFINGELNKKLKKIEEYNEIDCKSTYILHKFLLDSKSKDPKIRIKIEDKKFITEDPKKKKDELLIISDQFLNQLDHFNESDSDNEILNELSSKGIRIRSQLVLSHLLRFHKKESNLLWWSYFDRKNVSETFELKNEPESIYNSKLISSEKALNKKQQKTSTTLYKYKFETIEDSKLETEFRKGKLRMEIFETGIILEVSDINNKIGEIILKCSKTKYEKYISQIKEEQNLDIGKSDSIDYSVFPKNCSFIRYPEDPSFSLRENLKLQAEQWIDNPDKIPLSLRNFLDKEPNDEITELNKLIKNDTKNISTFITEFINSQKSTTLAIQGPPGTGKTTVTANCIHKMASSGLRIAVSSNSHAVINNLLTKVRESCDLNKFEALIYKIENSSKPDEDLKNKKISTIPTKKIAENIDNANVIGGTVWALSSLELTDKFDVLVIDEAGQMSMANLMVMARCTKSIILVGDQQQLSQPSQAKHNWGAGLSTLEYWLDEQKVVPNDLGIFLTKSWRMHPKITEIVSDLFYEGKLNGSKENGINQIFWGKTFKSNTGKIIPNNGVHFEMVSHEGNSQESQTEIDKIKEIIDSLTNSEFQYLSDGKIKKGKITKKEIIVIAPYNKQVQKLQDCLNEKAKISTVDKFQGREAAVAIFSLTSSSGNDAPRGLNFLLETNRLNVAISRAKCLSIIVGSKSLLSSSVNSINEAQLINNICKIKSNNEN